MTDERFPSYGSTDLMRYAESRYAECDAEKSGWPDESVNWLLDEAIQNIERALGSKDCIEILRSMADAHCYLAMAWEVHEDLIENANGSEWVCENDHTTHDSHVLRTAAGDGPFCPACNAKVSLVDG